jgi:hypothetical protein
MELSGFFSGSSIDFLKPLIALPMELPSSGSLPGPKKIMAMTRTIISSGIPMPPNMMTDLLIMNALESSSYNGYKPHADLKRPRLTLFNNRRILYYHIVGKVTNRK